MQPLDEERALLLLGVEVVEAGPRPQRRLPDPVLGVVGDQEVGDRCGDVRSADVDRLPADEVGRDERRVGEAHLRGEPLGVHLGRQSLRDAAGDVRRPGFGLVETGRHEIARVPDALALDELAHERRVLAREEAELAVGLQRCDEVVVEAGLTQPFPEPATARPSSTATDRRRGPSGRR